MFNIFYKKEIESLEKSLERYSSRINELNSLNDRLRNKIIDLESKVNDFNQKNLNSSCEVDFKKMQACSIERRLQKKCSKETNGWHILCNVEMHEALVRKFREYMKS